MILVAIAVSDQQAASAINGDSELVQILLYIQERDRSIAEWVEQDRLVEQEADAKKNEAEREADEKKNEAAREADAKKNEALAGLVAALNRSAAQTRMRLIRANSNHENNDIVLTV